MQIRNVLPRVRRSLEWLYIERDFFRPYELLLALPGFYLAAGFRSSSWKRVLFVVTRAVQLFQYAVWADRLYLGLIDASEHFEKALHYVNTFGVLTMFLLRMLVVRWYLPSVEKFKQYLRRQRGNARSSSVTHRGSYRKIVNIAIMFQLIGLADRLLFCCSGTYRQELYEMPSNLAALGWPVVVTVHVLSFDFASRWAAAYNVSLTGMNSIMMGLYDELVDIADEYRQLFAGGRSAENAEFWPCLERNIAQAVKRHATFISHLDQLKPFLQTTFLVMFYSAALFLAIGAFIITANGTTTYDVILSGFLFALLLECYWCCQLVDQLNDMVRLLLRKLKLSGNNTFGLNTALQNAQIGMHLYDLAWPMELQYTVSNGSRYRQVRSSLLIMMSKSRKTLGIRCGGMFEMSSEAFASLVKLTYTMLMFLRDTQNLS
uniref:Odorant receptor n=1 Tax=Anopheles culicifacies TaxID=139723 RepID=A0A182LWQ6_9DIPT